MSFAKYPAYRDSGVAWLGEVPGHWEVKRLKQLLSLLTEKTDRRANPVALENIESWSGRFIPTETEFAGEGVAFTRGDLLFGKLRPYLAKVLLVDSEGEAVGDFHVMRPSGAIAPRFAQYQLLNRTFIDIVDGSTFGSKMPRASWEFVGSMPLAIPPLAEQTAIATFLDHETARIDALVAEQEKLIALLQEKRQAVISHAVTKGLNPHAPMKDSGVEWLGKVPGHWIVGKCGFYLQILSGFAFPSSGFSSDDSNHRLLRGVNVGVSRLKWDDVVYWQRTEGDGLDDYEMAEGDLIIGMDRPLIGEGMRIAKVAAEDLPSLLLQRVASLKVGDKLHADYLHYLLASEMFVAHFSPETTGVSVPHISPDQIKKFVIPIPPVHEQIEIVNDVKRSLAKFGTLITESETAITLLQERRTALISAAVTGQIDVRGWAKAA
jgi:type I restriction enzyme S subunit